MDQQQINSQRQAAEIIISTVNSLAQSLDENERMIEQARVSEKATRKISLEIVEVMKHLHGEATTATTDPAAQLKKIGEIVLSIVSSLEGSVKSAGEDVIRLEATQAGMQRALSAMRETGAGILRNLEKIEQLADAEQPNGPRKIGDHPEGISNRRKAAALKQSRSSNDT